MTPPTVAPTTVTPPTVASTTVTPPTVAPATMTPPTVAPTTVSPPTAAPVTVSPPTVAPATMTPPTMAPTTVSPPTVTPATLAPPTVAPATVTPPTIAPPTTAPKTMVPPTVPPSTLSPQTFAPRTALTTVPASVSPLTFVPRAGALLTDPPATTVIASTVSPLTAVSSTFAPLTVPPPTVPVAPTLPSLVWSVCPQVVSFDHFTAGFEIVAVLNNANACGSKACPVFRKDMKRGLQSFGPALSYTTDEFAQAVASGEKLTTSYFIRGKSSVSRRTRLAFRLDSTSFLGQVDTSVACEVTVKAQRALSERLSSAAAIAVGVSVALGLVSGPTAATASRLDLLTQECETEDFHNGTLSWALHPTQVTVFESVYAGCIIGNLLIIVTVTVVFMALMFATVHFIPDIVGVSGLLDSSGVLRFPSVPLFFFLFLYQGTVVSTFKLLFYPRSPVDLGVAIPSFVICAGLPLWIARTLRVAVARSLIAYVYDDEKQQDWLVFIAGPGEWVSRSRANHFSQRYTSMLIVFAEERSWYVVFEFLSMFLLGGAMTLRTDSLVKCGHVRFFSGFVNLVFFVVEIIKWPHCRRRDHVLDPSIYLLQAVGLFFLSGGYYQARLEDWTIDAGAVCLALAIAVLSLKLLIDILLLIWLVYTGRRERIQDRAWRAEAAMDDQVLKDYVTEESSVPEEQNENAVGGELTSRLLEESPAVRRLSMADVFSPKRSSRSLVDRGRRRSIRPGREHLRELQNVTVDDYNEEFGALVSARRVSYVPARLEVTDGPRELAGVYCLCSALTKPPVWVQGTRTICFVDGKRWEIRDAAGVSARSADAKDADGILSPLDVAEWLVQSERSDDWEPSQLKVTPLEFVAGRAAGMKEFRDNKEVDSKDSKDNRDDDAPSLSFRMSRRISGASSPQSSANPLRKHSRPLSECTPRDTPLKSPLVPPGFCRAPGSPGRRLSRFELNQAAPAPPTLTLSSLACAEHSFNDTHV
ncbi:hypothetical protein DIPPA_09003 [Diplonema papillatum]|nr:hypothetical protein DIPPA_09003 [Diplonema papillatum]